MEKPAWSRDIDGFTNVWEMGNAFEYLKDFFYSFMSLIALLHSNSNYFLISYNPV
jgi:hypothetical protein